MEMKAFDEKAQLGLQLLLDHYWILRAERPDWYQLIREREKVLRRYIDEKFGWRLIVHQRFTKLEKIPAEPEAWMGIPLFQEPMDYAIFCCALSFLEGKAIEEQFLLSELCEEVRLDFPGELSLDWTLFTHRKSLIRAMQMLLTLCLIKQIDGDVSRFDHNQEHEVLYEVTVYSRYFMRSYPDDLSKYRNWKEILQEEWKLQGEDKRRRRVYRQLFLSPGIYRQGQNELDFVYLRNFRNRIHDDIEKHTDYQFSMFKNVAMLTVSELKMYQTTFPNQKAVSDLILQFSKLMHEKKEVYPPNEWGEIMLTESEFDQLIIEMKEKYGEGWAKSFRISTLAATRKEMVHMLEEWCMAKVNMDTMMLTVKPLAGVLTGAYSEDFLKGEKTVGNK